MTRAGDPHLGQPPVARRAIPIALPSLLRPVNHTRVPKIGYIAAFSRTISRNIKNLPMKPESLAARQRGSPHRYRQGAGKHFAEATRFFVVELEVFDADRHVDSVTTRFHSRRNIDGPAAAAGVAPRRIEHATRLAGAAADES